MDDEARLRRAQRAANELTETGAAFAKVRDDLMAEWLTTDLAATDRREAIFLAVRATAAAHMQLLKLVDDGKYVQKVAELTNERARTN